MPTEENNVAPDEKEIAAPEVRTTEELDKLADAGDVATNRERPMKAAPKEETPKPDFEFTHGGKKIQATKEQMVKWAQQGYDYPQKVQKLNQQFTQFEADKKKWDIYKQIDEFANKNPDWWKYIETGWKSREVPQTLQTQSPTASGNQATGQAPGTMAAIDPNNPLVPVVQELQKKLSEIVPTITEWKEERQLQAVQKADQELDQEVQSIRKSHSDLDWESLDESGKSLELRVLEHAQKSGISTFRAAFRDLFHDEIVKKAESLGKVSVSRGIQQRTKLGVLGETPTPKTRNPRSAQEIRNTSYEDLQREVNEELKAGIYR